MKKLFYLVLMVLLSFDLIAQVPGNFNYQAVLRNNSGELITDQSVDIRISIIDNEPTGSILYQEIHTKTTNSYGVVNLVIGDGTVESGTFSQINWGENDKYLGIEVDAGSGYVDMGTVQLLSVPYALYSEKALNAENLGSNAVYSTTTDTLFVVKDHDGNVVFAVFPDGAEVIVNESSKGKVGGFAVSGRNPSKSSDVTIFTVTPDSTRIYVSDTINAKGKVGGFAVSGRNPSKGTNAELFFVTADSTRVYVNEEPLTKGKVGGFAVSGRNPSKGLTNNYLQVLPDSTRIFVKDSTAGFGIANIESGVSESLLNLTKQNYLIGHNAGSRLTTGKFNSMFGYEAGNNALGASSNLFLGHRAGYSNKSGNNNVFIGIRTGYDMTGGYDNIFIGNLAGERSVGATHSTFIGNEAGKNVSGDDNICIGDRTGYNQYVTDNEFYATTIVGIDAGRNLRGNENTIVGNGAGFSAGGSSTGNYNVFVGAYAGGGGHLNRLGSGNVCIGYNAGAGSTGDNQLFIANNSSSTLIYGDFSEEEVTITGTLYASVSALPSDISLKKEFVKIQSGLKLLSGISAYYFKWNEYAKNELGFKDRQQVGIIAQDVEKTLPELVHTNTKGYKAVDYVKFTPILIDAVNEQQAQIEELKAENEELKQKLNEIIELLDKR